MSNSSPGIMASVMQSEAAPSHPNAPFRVKKARGIFRWLPSCGCNDMVMASWLFAIASLFFFFYAIFESTRYEAHSDMPPPNVTAWALDDGTRAHIQDDAYDTANALNIAANALFTIGSFVFIRVFKYASQSRSSKPPPMWSRGFFHRAGLGFLCCGSSTRSSCCLAPHCGTDALLGCWLFLGGAALFMLVPLPYLIIHPSFYYSAALVGGIVMTAGSALFVYASYKEKAAEDAEEAEEAAAEAADAQARAADAAIARAGGGGSGAAAGGGGGGGGNNSRARDDSTGSAASNDSLSNQSMETKYVRKFVSTVFRDGLGHRSPGSPDSPGRARGYSTVPEGRSCTRSCLSSSKSCLSFHLGTDWLAGSWMMLICCASMTVGMAWYLIREVAASDSEEAAAEASGLPRPQGSLYYRDKKVRFYLFTLIQCSLFFLGSMYWVAGSYPIDAVNERYGQEAESEDEEEQLYFGQQSGDVEQSYVVPSSPKTPVMANYGSVADGGAAPVPVGVSVAAVSFEGELPDGQTALLSSSQDSSLPE